MSPNERALRLMFSGAHLEIESHEVRVYARPGVDANRARYLIESALCEAERVALAGHDNFRLYPGVMPDLERDPADDLAQVALQNPTVQRLMAMFGAELVSVKPAKPIK